MGKNAQFTFDSSHFTMFFDVCGDVGILREQAEPHLWSS
jgi:hypothetical protein